MFKIKEGERAFAQFHKIIYDDRSEYNFHRFICIMKSESGRYKREVVFTNEQLIPKLFRAAIPS